MTDYSHLQRDLDRVKSMVFLDKNRAAFLGSIMCSLNFRWDTTIQSACTDGIDLLWNPDWFISLPQPARKTVLMHEIWHVAKMHGIRVESRDPEIWNDACDYHINNGLYEEKYSFDGAGGLLDPQYDKMAEEQIYNILIQLPKGNKPKWAGDLKRPSNQKAQAVIQTVVRAVQQAKLVGQAGSIPGDVTEHLDKFLNPVVPWQTLLMEFFTDLLDEDFSWRKPNRRFQDMYLPSRFLDEGRLDHLTYFLDVSGSITSSDIQRTSSEVKYIQEELKPRKLSLVQFDTRIQHVKEYEEDEPFEAIEIHGRGGTAWAPVKRYIDEHQPTCAIVFTDMDFMDRVVPLAYDIPIIWIAVRASHATAPFGKIIHLEETP